MLKYFLVLNTFHNTFKVLLMFERMENNKYITKIRIDYDVHFLQYC